MLLGCLGTLRLLAASGAGHCVRSLILSTFNGSCVGSRLDAPAAPSRSYVEMLLRLPGSLCRQPAGQTAEPEASPLSPRAPSTAAASTADWRHPLSQSRTTTVTQEPSDIELDVEAGLPRQDSNTSSR